MQLIIRLLSDLCTCSGDTHNSLVDTDVVYDEPWYCRCRNA